MNSERSTLLNDLEKSLTVANAKVTYHYVEPTLLAKKIKSKYPELVEDKVKEVSIEFNGYTNHNFYEKNLELLVKRLESIIQDKFSDKSYYLDCFKSAFKQISKHNGQRESFFVRGDIIEGVDPKSDFWVDEVDNNLSVDKKRKLSEFIIVQQKYLLKVLGLIEPTQSISTIEDLIPNKAKLEHLRNWLVENDYCDADFKWLDKSKGRKERLGFILSFIIPQMNFSNIQASNKELSEITSNSFDLKVSVRTIQESLNKYQELKSIFKTLRL